MKVVDASGIVSPAVVLAVIVIVQVPTAVSSLVYSVMEIEVPESALRKSWKAAGIVASYLTSHVAGERVNPAILIVFVGSPRL